MEYYSAIKRNEILIHAWMNPENMLSEINQIEKVWIGKSVDTERLVAARA